MGITIVEKRRLLFKHNDELSHRARYAASENLRGMQAPFHKIVPDFVLVRRRMLVACSLNDPDERK